MLPESEEIFTLAGRGFKGAFAFEYTYLESDRGGRNVFRSFGSVDIRARWIRRRPPNRFLCWMTAKRLSP